jgi:glycosyl transferase, family 25
MDKIEKIVYINLERRKDRREEIENEFKRMEIPEDKIVRFEAIPHSYGLVGCGQSHRSVLEIAKKEGWKNVLILEDDFDFVVSKEEFEELIHYFFETMENNKDWDVIMLSYNLFHREHYTIEYNNNEKIGKIGFAQTASAYLVNQHYYDALIENVSYGNLLLDQTRQHWIYANDVYWKILQEKDNWFYFKNRIGIQRKSLSDNTGRIEEYKC